MSQMTRREVGPYRVDVIEKTGIYVSTIVRESSAMEYGSPYFETMAFWLDGRQPPGERTLLWQSAAGYQRAADRMHDVAVRWFSREGREVPVTCTCDNRRICLCCCLVDLWLEWFGVTAA